MSRRLIVEKRLIESSVSLSERQLRGGFGSNRMVSELVKSERLICGYNMNAIVAILICAIASTSCLKLENNTDTTSRTSIRLLLNKSNQRLAKTTTPTSGPKNVPSNAPQVTPATSISISESPTTSSSSSTSNLIESILIRVESLNLNRPTNQQQQTYLSDAYDNNNVTTSSSSEAEEDTLELSSSPITSTQSPPEVSTPTNAIKVVRNNSTNKNRSIYHEHYSLTQTPEVSTNDPDYELIESNKVISGAATSENDRALAISLDASTPTARSQLSLPVAETTTCEQAYTECAFRKACAPSLRAFNEECQSELAEMFSGQSGAQQVAAMAGNGTSTHKCPPKCLRALVGLRSSDNGAQLMGCDCQEDEYCSQSKSRSELVCQKEVEQVIAPETQVSCSIASWICMSEQSCLDALRLFYENCRSSLLSHRQCTPQCNNSLSILYKQAKASKLINCYCDGSEEFPCEKYKTYTERYCLADSSNEAVASKTTGSKHLFALASDDIENRYDDDESVTESDSDKETPNEEDQNDNEAIHNHRSSNLATDYDSGIYLDNGDESAATSVSNAKQQEQDNNWIPLMSNRFFNNLQRQRQQSLTGTSSNNKQKQTNQQQKSLLQQRPSSNNNRQTNATKHRSRQKKSQQQQQPNNNRHLRKSRVLAYANSATDRWTWMRASPLVCWVVLVSLVFSPHSRPRRRVYL